MSNQLEILEVLECAKNGDARCQRIIYEVITPFIYHLILKYVPNEDDAADLAQETMITAFEKLKNYNSDIYLWFCYDCQGQVKHIPGT